MFIFVLLEPLATVYIIPKKSMWLLILTFAKNLHKIYTNPKSRQKNLSLATSVYLKVYLEGIDFINAMGQYTFLL